jgi:3-oxoacyl-[acyl-carrier protein] reductase
MADTLHGKVAIVTGAGRGIGRAIAIGYARAGAAVCCAARTHAEVEAVAREIQAAGGRAIAVRADVTRPDDVEAMVAATCEAFGGLDVLVANAGVEGGRATIERADAQAWRQTLEVNLFGAFHSMRAAIPALRARGGGRIIAIGSAIRQGARGGRSDYACAKAGLWMLVTSLAQELAPDGIEVYELIPGPVRTGMTLPRQRLEAAGKAPPSTGKDWFKDPEDVVPLALSLAGDPPPGPSGQSFRVTRDA